ncbi:MAG: hypothetical protein RLZZ361_324 [Cyanobacteriota bacterium]|jgi:hypothetical protein
MIDISGNSRNKCFFDLQNKLNEHLNGNNKNKALDHTSETEIQSSSDGNKLKIALHVDCASAMGSNSRTVTLRSLTNPSVAVRFDAISPLNPTFTPDDQLFTALDFILKLVPQDFNSINTHSEPQEGDINISLGDHEDITPYQYTKNKSGKLVSKRTGIDGLSSSRAPQKAKA